MTAGTQTAQWGEEKSYSVSYRLPEIFRIRIFVLHGRSNCCPKNLLHVWSLQKSTWMFPIAAVKYPVHRWNQRWVAWKEHTMLCVEEKGRAHQHAGQYGGGAALLPLGRHRKTPDHLSANWSSKEDGWSRHNEPKQRSKSTKDDRPRESESWALPHSDAVAWPENRHRKNTADSSVKCNGPKFLLMAVQVWSATTETLWLSLCPSCTVKIPRKVE